MQGKLGDKIRLLHILDAIHEIEEYTIGVNFENFNSNAMMRFACIKQLEIIGEASNHLSEETKLKFNDIECKLIIGMRNIFIHEYFGIDSKVVWEIIKNDLQELKIKLSKT